MTFEYYQKWLIEEKDEMEETLKAQGKSSRTLSPRAAEHLPQLQMLLARIFAGEKLSRHEYKEGMDHTYQLTYNSVVQCYVELRIFIKEEIKKFVERVRENQNSDQNEFDKFKYYCDQFTAMRTAMEQGYKMTKAFFSLDMTNVRYFWDDFDEIEHFDTLCSQSWLGYASDPTTQLFDSYLLRAMEILHDHTNESKAGTIDLLQTYILSAHCRQDGHDYVTPFYQDEIATKIEKYSEKFLDERKKKMGEVDANQYTNEVAKLMKEHNKLADLMQPNMKAKMMAQFKEMFLINNTDQFRNTCLELMKRGEYEKVLEAYTLLKAVEKDMEIPLEFAKTIGNDLDSGFNKFELQKRSVHTVYCDYIHDHYARYNSIVVEKLEDNKHFHDALTQAYTPFINRRVQVEDNHNVYAYEIIPMYLDKVARKKDLELTDELRDRYKFLAVTMLEIMHDKDAFIVNYQKKLSQRLLSGESETPEFESFMISELERMCGSDQNVRDMRTMYSDMQLWPNLKTGFNEYIDSNDKRTNVKLDLRILSNHWGMEELLFKDVNFPEPMSEFYETAKNYYETLNPGRKLKWCHHDTLVEFKLLNTKKKPLVSTNAICAAIMLFFNKEPAQKISHIATQLGISREQLDSYVDFLLVEGLITSTDRVEITLNDNYDNKKVKIILKYRPKLASPEERQQQLERVNKEREGVIQCAIVKIMKSKKKYGHNELVADVAKACIHLFEIQGAFVKKVIEKSIAQEYLERDPKDINVYHYVA